MTNSLSDKFNGNIGQWKISAAVSLLIHLVLATLIFLTPLNKKQRTSPFIASLLTPDEITRVNPKTSLLRLPPQTGAETRGRQAPLRRSMPRGVVRPDLQARAQTIPSAPPASGPAMERDLLTGAKGIETPLPALPLAAGSQNSGRPAVRVPSRKGLLADAREAAEIPAQREEAKKDTGITFDTNEFRYTGYMSRLKEKIEGIWKYPPEAAARGIYGDLKIKFTIKKDGRLGSIELERTSGHTDLDEAAMQALRDAEPFWPLPDEWGRDAMTIDGHFVYSIYGAHIR